MVAVAAALRLVGLGRDGLWTDECSTIHLARLGLGGLWRELTLEVQAPLFYVLERGVVGAWGASEWTARLIPALAGIALVPAGYLLGRRLAGKAGGLGAALLLAVSPMAVAYSREARAYSLLMLLMAAALVLALRALERPSLARAAWVALPLAVAAWTHAVALVYAFALVAGFAAEGALRADRWRQLRAWTFTGALVVGGLGPWWPVVLAQSGAGGAAYSWALPRWHAHFPWQVARSLCALTPAAPPPIRNSVDFLPAPAWVMLLPCAGLVALGVVVSRRRGMPGGIALALSVALPLLVLFAVSWAAYPIYVEGRVDALALPAFVVLLALGASAIPGRWGPALLLALALTSAGPVRVALADHRSWERGFLRDLALAVTDGDVVIVTGSYRHSFEHYLLGSRPRVRLMSFPTEREAHQSWVDWSALDTKRLQAEADDTARVAVEATRAAGGARVWVLLSPLPGSDLLDAALDRTTGAGNGLDLNYLNLKLRWHLLASGSPAP